MKRRSHKNNKHSKELKLQAVKDYWSGERGLTSNAYKDKLIF